jgi:hypothetical protein
MSPRRGALLPGIILIGLGGWLLAQNLGLPLPGLERLWPIFPMGLGLVLLLRYFTDGRRDEGLVFSGIAGLLTGAFFLAFTLSRWEWAQMRQLWPTFIVIGGVAFLAQWLVRPRQWGLLIPMSLALLVGGGLLLINTGALQRELAEQLFKFWPVALILAGLSTLASAILRVRSTPADEKP